VAPGQEPALIDRISAGLPRSYRPEVARSGRHPLTAEAGDYVAVRGGIVGTGQVRVAADTGCRPMGGRVREAQPSDTGDRAPVEAVLAVFGIAGPHWQTHRVDCPQGGSVRTVEAAGPAGSAPASLIGPLQAKSPTAEVVIARPDLYVYRAGPVGMVARTRDGVVTVTATTGCGPA
jgi:hypothetical protein